jgi:hypothetical protein
VANKAIYFWIEIIALIAQEIKSKESAKVDMFMTFYMIVRKLDL